jgi:hypothetical protein
MKKLVLLLFFQSLFVFGSAQELMSKIKDSSAGELNDLPAVLALNDGSKVVGTVSKVVLSQGLLTNVSLKLQDGSTQKYKPTEIDVLKIRSAKPTMFSVVDSLGNPIKKVIYTQYVFDHPYRTEGKVKPEMRQLLNPGFDSKIKIFFDPKANQSRSISIKGEPLVNDQANEYIFIKEGVVYYVEERTYKKDFEKLYGNCKAMSKLVHLDEIAFEGLAGHVLLYDHFCSDVK